MLTNKDDKIKESCLSIIDLISKDLSLNGKQQANEIKNTLNNLNNLNNLKNNTTKKPQKDEKLEKDNYEPEA